MMVQTIFLSTFYSIFALVNGAIQDNSENEGVGAKRAYTLNYGFMTVYWVVLMLFIVYRGCKKESNTQKDRQVLIQSHQSNIDENIVEK